MSKIPSVELSLVILVFLFALGGFVSIYSPDDSLTGAVVAPKTFSYSTGLFNGLPTKEIKFNGAETISTITGQTCYYHKNTGNYYKFSFAGYKDSKLLFTKELPPATGWFGGKGGACNPMSLDMKGTPAINRVIMSGVVVGGSPNPYITVMNINTIQVVEIPLTTKTELPPVVASPTPSIELSKSTDLKVQSAEIQIKYYPGKAKVSFPLNPSKTSTVQIVPKEDAREMMLDFYLDFTNNKPADIKNKLRIFSNNKDVTNTYEYYDLALKKIRFLSNYLSTSELKKEKIVFKFEGKDLLSLELSSSLAGQKPIVAQPKAPQYPNCISTVYSGPSQDKLDLVLFGNVPMQHLAASFNNQFFVNEPFKSLKNKFNVWYVPAPYTIKRLSAGATVKNIYTGKSIYDITGDASLKKKLKKAVSKTTEQVKAEVKRVEQKVESAGKKIEAEVKRTGKSVEKEVKRWGRDFDRAITRKIANEAARAWLHVLGMQRDYDINNARNFARSACPFADQMVYLQDTKFRPADKSDFPGFAPEIGGDLSMAMYSGDGQPSCYYFNIDDEQIEMCMGGGAVAGTIKTIQHELGHTIAGLEDEYNVKDTYNTAGAKISEILDKLNLAHPVSTSKNCRNPSDCSKFKSIDSGAGCFKTCNSDQYYRPYQSSAMGGGGEFGKVHQYYFNEAMNKYK